MCAPAWQGPPSGLARPNAQMTLHQIIWREMRSCHWVPGTEYWPGIRDPPNAAPYEAQLIIRLSGGIPMGDDFGSISKKVASFIVPSTAAIQYIFINSLRRRGGHSGPLSRLHRPYKIHCSYKISLLVAGRSASNTRSVSFRCRYPGNFEFWS